MLLLDHLDRLGVPMGVDVVVGERPAVLEAAGLLDRFPHRRERPGRRRARARRKPAPDTFLHAAAELDGRAERSVVLEDAVSGVRAGAAGHFGLVVGVDRGRRRGPARAGAGVVVADLAELVPDGAA